MIGAVLFDMDGVVLDSEFIYIKSLKEYLKSLGVYAEEKDLIPLVGMKIQAITEKLIVHYQLQKPIDELIYEQHKMYLNFLEKSKDLKTMEGFVEFIRDLKHSGIKIALASSSNHETVDMVLKRFDLFQYFDEIVSGDMVTNSKPAPDIFLLAAQKVGCKPEQCIVIEDSVNGIRAGKQAGMFVVGFKGSVIEQDTGEADASINSFCNQNCLKLHDIYRKTVQSKHVY